MVFWSVEPFSFVCIPTIRRKMLPPSSGLKRIAVAYCSETSDYNYKTMWRDKPEDHNKLSFHRCGNLKSRTLKTRLVECIYVNK
jgi:hypothetical protein